MTAEAMKVVCVDDDDFMLKALGRMIRRMRPDWQIELVEDANHWVADVNHAPSVVISDLLMPGKMEKLCSRNYVHVAQKLCGCC